ncbi:MAG: phosphate signaling complex protein PhoU [Nitriliruptorales bacterium]|nr:phosphate signaling complex protein PhoU [Nitriliruptorales bacterium]
MKLRREYREELSELEDRILSMGSRVLDMLGEAMEALIEHDLTRAAAVIRTDDLLDAQYEEVHEHILTTIALQAPVATQLRLLSAFLHCNIHLERMGDLCVNIAKIVTLIDQDSEDEELIAQVGEMAQHARRVIERALEALAKRDLDIVAELPAMDDPIDKLNRGLFKRMVRLAISEEKKLDWAMRMVLVSRYLERMGDHAVDIGEQVYFIVTGNNIELASNSPRE